MATFLNSSKIKVILHVISGGKSIDSHQHEYHRHLDFRASVNPMQCIGDLKWTWTAHAHKGKMVYSCYRHRYSDFSKLFKKSKNQYLVYENHVWSFEPDFFHNSMSLLSLPVTYHSPCSITLTRTPTAVRVPQASRTLSIRRTGARALGCLMRP